MNCSTVVVNKILIFKIKLCTKSSNLPTTTPSQENEIGDTIWEKVYDTLAKVEPNIDVIDKVETIKKTFGLKSEFRY